MDFFFFLSDLACYIVDVVAGGLSALRFNGLHSLKLGGRPAKSKTITLEEPVDESTGSLRKDCTSLLFIFLYSLVAAASC